MFLSFFFLTEMKVQNVICQITKMGANSSSISELPDNEYLKKLSGAEPISENDPFWNQLLSFSFTAPTNRYSDGVCWVTKPWKHSHKSDKSKSKRVVVHYSCLRQQGSKCLPVNWTSISDSEISYHRVVFFGFLSSLQLQLLLMPSGCQKKINDRVCKRM